MISRRSTWLFVEREMQFEGLRRRTILEDVRARPPALGLGRRFLSDLLARGVPVARDSSRPWRSFRRIAEPNYLQ